MPLRGRPGGERIVEQLVVALDDDDQRRSADDAEAEIGDQS